MPSSFVRSFSPLALQPRQPSVTRPPSLAQLLVVALIALAGACGGTDPVDVDAGEDVDSSIPVAVDSGSVEDAGTDASEIDAGSTDADVDAGVDADVDSGTDGGVDARTDAGTPPTITGFAPSAGAGVGLPVTITGTGFVDVTHVLFAGTIQTSFVVVSSSEITTTVPIGATTGPIEIGNAAGSATSAPFTVIPAPVISDVTPSAGGAVGAAVTIAGSNLSGATSIRFGDVVQAVFTVVSDTQITTTVPATAISAPIEVTTGGGTDLSSTFVVLEPPVLVRAFPMAQGSGGLVTIVGENLANPTSVTFGNGVAATVVRATGLAIVARVPTGAASGSIAVTTANGTGTLAGFVVEDIPAITAVASPASGDTVRGCVPIVYTVAQAQSLPVDVVVEVDGVRATGCGGTPSVEPLGVVGVPTSPAGTTHTFLWNSTLDRPGADVASIAIRVRARRFGVAGSDPGAITGVHLANGFAIAAPVSFPAAMQPADLATGDFDRNGRADLVVATESGDAVAVLLADGDASFGAPVPHPTGAAPSSVAVADVDEDGRLDLVVSNAGSDTLSFLRGNGNGTFQAPIATATGSSPSSVVLADVDRDGTLDAVVANEGDSTIAVHHGYEDGSFAAATTSAVGIGPRALAAADLNRDGKVDVVSVNAIGGSASVLLGIGDGTFANAVGLPVGIEPVAIAIADVNRDGKLDLAIADRAADAAVIVRGNGNGTFQTASSIAAGDAPTDVIVRDLNRDGRVDLVATLEGEDAVAVMFATAAAGFAAPRTFAAGADPTAIVTLDADRDGHLDLATVGAGDGSISVLVDDTVARCETILESPTQAAPSLQSSSSTETAIADFDRDGRLDLAYSASNGARVMRGRGNGTFVDDQRVSSGSEATALLAVDVDADGFTDVVWTERYTGNLGVALGRGDGTFEAPLTLALGGVVPRLAAGRLDDDDHLDLVVARDSDRSVVALLGDGTGGFTTASTTQFASAATDLALADLDGDGTDDLVVADGRLEVLLGNGDGSFGASVPRLTAGLGIGQVEIGDMTSDGIPDLVATPSGPTGSSKVWIVVGAGNGTFTTETDFADYYRGDAIGLADLDRDGDLDVVTLAPDWSRWDVLLGNGAGALGNPTSFELGSRPRGISIADVDGTGSPDLIAADGYLSGAVVVAGLGDGRFRTNGYLPFASNAYEVAVADFDADGLRDIAAADASYVRITRGYAGGRFLQGALIPAGTGPHGIVASDLDRDGLLDLTVVSYQSDSLTVLRGNGNATFTAASTFGFPASSRPYGVVVQDFDDDGRPDAAVTAVYANGVRYFTGNGDGTFAVGPTYTTALGGESLVTTDVDRDGRTDLIVSPGGSSGLALLRGNGDGTFQAATSLSFYSSPHGIAMVDLNRDGRVEPLVATYRSFSYQLATGEGTFGSVVQVPVPTGFVNVVGVGDLDDDGLSDVVVANTYSIYRFHANVDGSFTFVTAYPFYANSLRIEDIDHDGRVDLLTGREALRIVSR